MPRPDLMQRLLVDTEREITKRETELNDLRVMANMLRKRLAIETKTIHLIASGNSPTKEPQTMTPLTSFILTMLDSSNTQSFVALREGAKSSGLLDNSRFPGRSMNMALRGLIRKGCVEKEGDLYKLGKNG